MCEMSVSYENIRVFQGSSIGKTCSICKLEIKEQQDLLQCIWCKNLFHPEHLYKWLEIEETCPICKTNLKESSSKIESKKLSLKRRTLFVIIGLLTVLIYPGILSVVIFLLDLFYIAIIAVSILPVCLFGIMLIIWGIKGDSHLLPKWKKAILYLTIFYYVLFAIIFIVIAALE
jgi:hypothetical protein